jgi:hypothetical protein
VAGKLIEDAVGRQIQLGDMHLSRWGSVQKRKILASQCMCHPDLLRG